MKKFASIAFVALLLTSVSQLASASFYDVAASSPNYDAILYAQNNDIVSGYSDGTFRPANHINRAEFTKVVVGAAFGYNASHDPSGYDINSLSGIPFSDVANGAWYNPYLRKAFQRGVISGYSNGTFKPSSDINFAEAAKIIVKSFGYETVSDPIWYKPYVEKLSELKAIPATIDGFSHPITRGEMVEMIYRIKTGFLNDVSLTYENVASGTAAGDVPDDGVVFEDGTPVNDGTSTSGGTSTGSGTSTSGGATTGGGTSSSSGAPVISSTCTVFPADNPWNRDISADPVDSNSAGYLTYIKNLGGNQFLHADFGGGGAYGIPYVLVPGTQPKVPIDFLWYGSESDPGPYPIPPDAPVEGGSDAHVLAVDKDNCKLYELYAAAKTATGWAAGSGAVFDLTSNALRPEGWTSADAAGLPIYPGLVRYDEVAAGEIKHAIRVTFKSTQKAYIHPATHFASSITDTNAPPMGLRLRLKADFDISGYTGQSRVILQAFKKYGIIVADNGSNWFVTGSKDTHWSDDDLNQLKKVPGSAFEVVQSGTVVKG